MAQRPRHPRKDIEAILASAEDQGWRIVTRNGHCWGRLYCPFSDRDGCRVSIWSTPKNDHDHVETIAKVMRKCPHQKEEADV